MDSSSGSQFEQLVDDASAHVRAHLCEGDPSTAVLWDDPTGITVRLSLLGDEIWLFAGSGVLIRHIAPSDGEFDLEGLLATILHVLRGEAIEYFGVRGQTGDDVLLPTGFAVPDGNAGGTTARSSVAHTRLAGPYAAAKAQYEDSM